MISRISYCILFFLVFAFAKTNAQIVPSGIEFQAVARDFNNNAAANKNVFTKVSLLQGSPTGTNVYTETFQVITNNDGVFSITIGKGNQISGVTSLTNINWESSSFFVNIKVAISPTLNDPTWNPDNNYIDVGTAPFWSVPYAFVSQKSLFSDTSITISQTLSSNKGGTGINNNGKTITLGGNIITGNNFILSGNYSTTLTSTGITNVTLPTNGVLATLSGTETLTNKTINGLTPTSLAKGFKITGGTQTSTTLTVVGDVTVGGTNTGDQFIKLTGDAIGEGYGTFSTTVNSIGGVNSSTISGFDTRIASNTNSITSLTNAIASNTESLTSLEINIATLKLSSTDNLASLETKVNANTASITSNTNAITSNTNSITSLTEVVTSNTASITTLISKAGNLVVAGSYSTTLTSTGTTNLTLPTSGTIATTDYVTNSIGGLSSSTITSIVSSVNSATSDNTPNTIVKRDGSGDFAAGEITATSITSSGNISSSSINTSSISATGITASTLTLTTPLSITSGGTGTNTSTGTGSLVLSASPTLTGTTTAGAIAATSLTTSGSITATGTITAATVSATSINASTVASTLFTGTLSGTASGLTTARTIALTGSLSGTGKFDGLSNLTIDVDLSDIKSREWTDTYTFGNKSPTAQKLLTSIGTNSEGRVYTFTSVNIDNNLTATDLLANQIFIGSGTNTTTAVYMTGDVSIVSSGATTVNSIGGVSSSTINTVASLVNSATNSNTANTIVERDSGGDFQAADVQFTSITSTGNITTTSLTASGSITATGTITAGSLSSTSIRASTLTLTTPLSITSGGTGTNTSTGTGSLVLSASPTISSATLSGTTTISNGVISATSLNLSGTNSTTVSAVLTNDGNGNAYWKKPIVTSFTLISSSSIVTTTFGDGYSRVLMHSFTYTPTSTGSYTLDIEISGEGENNSMNSSTIPLLYQLSISTINSNTSLNDNSILGYVAGNIQPVTTTSSSTVYYRQVLPTLYATKTFSNNNSFTIYIYAKPYNYVQNPVISAQWNNYSVRIREY